MPVDLALHDSVLASFLFFFRVQEVYLVGISPISIIEHTPPLCTFTWIIYYYITYMGNCHGYRSSLLIGACFMLF